MHGLPDWFGWMLIALSYAPHAAVGLAVAGAVYAVRRLLKKK